MAIRRLAIAAALLATLGGAVYFAQPAHAVTCQWIGRLWVCN